ncbi:hypothetical protein PSPO_a1154 [Pseudoalteromonas spongiae UST010723-006]|nr:hypothetical protein PSPO_a1154 [Pseudoalteromonas spongiae UST010723-006]
MLQYLKFSEKLRALYQSEQILQQKLQLLTSFAEKYTNIHPFSLEIKAFCLKINH